MAYNTLLQPNCLPHRRSRVELLLRVIFFVLLCFTLLLPSCKPEHIDESAQKKYFDLKGYFEAEITDLNRRSAPISKTVNHNKVVETKDVLIKDWKSELGLFIASDINKPSWRESYNVTDNGNVLIYEAKDPELKTREIIINKPDNKVKWILVFNSTRNMLYQTTEKLSYFPDSAYVISKTQYVRLLGTNQYKITGKF